MVESALLEQWAAYEPFAGVSASTGLAVDQINYVFCLLLSYPLALVFRHIPTSSPGLRHFVSGFVGLLFGIFCFRVYLLHVFVLSAGVYALILLDKQAKNVHLTVSVFAVAYLAFCHLYRQIYFTGLYTLDVTGPLMVLVQKLSSLAFSIYDAKHKQQKNELQQRLAVDQIPTPLEYFGHVFFFPGFLAGPLHFFRDYKNFIENGNPLDGSLTAMISKFFFAIVCLVIKFLPGILGLDNSHGLLVDEKFVSETTFFYRILHMYFASVCIRMQYYFAWILAEGANNAAGFGWREGNHWDLVTNVNVLKVEFATNLKMVLDNWNIQTQTWLRFVCYDRTNSVSKTMLLSAIWHGLYPGYFLTFLTASLQTEAARKARRVIRPIFHGLGQAGVVVYDVITWATTAFILNYIVGPFVVLEFWGSLQFWHNFFFVGHLGALAMVLLLQGGKSESKGEKHHKPKAEKSEAEQAAAKKTE